MDRDRYGRWMPVLLVALAVPTLIMVMIAVAVIFDRLPDIDPDSITPGGESLVTPNKILPLISATIGVIFVVTIFRRYRAKGGLHLLIWGIGLAFFATGSITESLYGFLGWHDVIFRFWYLFGAVLIAAWLGQGTVQLLAPKKVAMVTLAILMVASGYATIKVATASLDPTNIAREVADVSAQTVADEDGVLLAAAALLQETARDEDGTLNPREVSPLIRALSDAAGISADSGPVAVVEAMGAPPNVAGIVDGSKVIVGSRVWLAENAVGQDVSDQLAQESALRVFVAIDGVVAGDVDSLAAIFLSGHAITSPDVRILTPFFNIYGTIALIGGALWSSWVFWRKGIMPYRAIGNVLIALGAIVGGGISALSRFGALSLLYIGELTSLLLVFAGFVLATRSVQSNQTTDTSTEKLRSDA